MSHMGKKQTKNRMGSIFQTPLVQQEAFLCLSLALAGNCFLSVGELEVLNLPLTSLLRPLVPSVFEYKLNAF